MQIASARIAEDLKPSGVSFVAVLKFLARLFRRRSLEYNFINHDQAPPVVLQKHGGHRRHVEVERPEQRPARIISSPHQMNRGIKAVVHPVSPAVQVLAQNLLPIELRIVTTLQTLVIIRRLR